MTKRTIDSKVYSELPQEQQLDILRTDGAYVGKRIASNQTVILYQLYGFYVELFFTKYRKEVGHFVVSDNTDVLDPYLKQINVRDLDFSAPLSHNRTDFDTNISS
jgi:hypothetical protein